VTQAEKLAGEIIELSQIAQHIVIGDHRGRCRGRDCQRRGASRRHRRRAERRPEEFAALVAGLGDRRATRFGRFNQLLIVGHGRDLSLEWLPRERK